MKQTQSKRTVSKMPHAGTALASAETAHHPTLPEQHFSPKSFASESAYYLLQAFVVVSILALELDLLTRNLAVPIVYTGDAVYFLMMVKAIVREGWWWHVQSLSAPYGADLVGVPLLGAVDGVMIKFIGLFTHKAGLVLNLFWFTTIVLAGAISSWSMRRMGIQRWVAFVLGILYAVSPHIYYRNESHLMLAHHVIPPVALLAIVLCAGRSQSLRGTTLYVLLVGCVLMGLSYVYFAFFSCFILLVAGVTGYMRTRELRNLGLAAVATAVVAVTLAIAMIPSVLMWASDPGSRKAITFKAPIEADIYGLKIRQLITPTPRNPIPFLAALAAKSAAARFPTDDNESFMSRIGTVASLGLLFLLVIGVLYTRSERSRSMEFMKALGVLTLACILLGTVGGFGSVFNLLVAPDIRCYNRISIFIAYFSLAAVGFILTWFGNFIIPFLRKSIPALDGNSALAAYSLKAASAVSLAVLLWFGVLDQNEAYAINGRRAEYEATFHAQYTLVRQIETILPKGAMVYQLPNVAFSEGPHPVNRMFSNDPAEISSVSDSVRWSWPAISAAATAFEDEVRLLSAPDLVDKLIASGFKGMLIDRFGYPDNGTALIEGLTDYVGHAPTDSEDARYAFFGLTKAPEKKLVLHHNYDWGTPLVFANDGNGKKYLVSGWSQDGGTLGKQATIYFNTAVPPKDIVLRARIVPALFGDIKVRPVKVFVNDSPLGDWQVQKSDWYSVVIPRRVAQEKFGLSIRFEMPNAVSPSTLGINIDGRVLSVAFAEMTLSLR